MASAEAVMVVVPDVLHSTAIDTMISERTAQPKTFYIDNVNHMSPWNSLRVQIHKEITGLPKAQVAKARAVRRNFGSAIAI